MQISTENIVCIEISGFCNFFQSVVYCTPPTLLSGVQYTTLWKKLQKCSLLATPGQRNIKQESEKRKSYRFTPSTYMLLVPCLHWRGINTCNFLFVFLKTNLFFVKMKGDFIKRLNDVQRWPLYRRPFMGLILECFSINFLRKIFDWSFSILECCYMSY